MKEDKETEYERKNREYLEDLKRPLTNLSITVKKYLEDKDTSTSEITDK